ncbi:MAG: sigma-70 family RNA polymerase sigma factor [Acidimicrobiia bacterium]|jgi:RNA polymerase sigma-70 factor (ECF subfamily)
MVAEVTSRDARFVDLYQEFCGRVDAYCRRRCSAERVDDAVAETFLTAWKKIDDVPMGEGTLPWLYGVARRVVAHQWRSSSRVDRLRTKLESLGVATQAPPDDVVVMDEESVLVLRALSRLKALDQEVLRLSVWEDLNHIEIAQVLNVSHDVIKKRFSRAKTRLAEEINRLIQEKSPAAQEGGAW